MIISISKPELILIITNLCSPRTIQVSKNPIFAKYGSLDNKSTWIWKNNLSEAPMSDLMYIMNRTFFFSIKEIKDAYGIIKWPDSQDIFDKDWYDETILHPSIASAYFVPIERLENL